ncbi:hypothetical protein D5F01_LYC22442 [Larimichthys crocea]|uniref:Myb/SANT-like DNA-binding domain-containing protein n=1 Tax=Larimichthys crocea TaxID=215358 RepID=A0A6G0HIE9_LARCR|nr:hypothetical protein D5F01_LYC22442 [Larimichthys crocea]
MADGRETVYKWTDDDVAGLIRLRKTNDRLFSGKRFASAAGWEAILKEMGLTGVVTPARAGKKWENLKKTYKELRKPPTGSGTESGESTARDWKWFSLMDEAIVPPEPECQGAEQDSESEEPAPPKRQRRDPVLELLERQEKRAEEREKREEDREERLLNLLEKIVEKM